MSKSKKVVLASVEMQAGRKRNTVFFTCSVHSKECYRHSISQQKNGLAVAGSYYTCKFCQFSELDGDTDAGYRRECNVIGRIFDVVNEKIDICDYMTIDEIDCCVEYRLFEVTE